MRRIAEIQSAEERRRTVLALDLTLADELPAFSAGPVFWSPHQPFTGITAAESLDRYFALLYYLDYEPEQFVELLRRDSLTQKAVFGWGRPSGRLVGNWRPISEEEIAAAARAYQDFVRNFATARDALPEIGLVVIPNNFVGELRGLRRWSELEPGEEVGDYRIYAARPIRSLD
jgi:hypothetical protein